MRFLAAIFAAVALIAAHPASAQQEPPSRVGRVSFIQGTLAFHTEGEAAWSAAEVNFPVATGSAFWTDPKSRAELRVGPDSIDLAGNTDIEITRLEPKVMQLAVPWPELGSAQGTAEEAGSRFAWRQTISATPNPAFHKIEIVVVDPATPDYALSSLVGYLGQPAQQ